MLLVFSSLLCQLWTITSQGNYNNRIFIFLPFHRIQCHYENHDILNILIIILFENVLKDCYIIIYENEEATIYDTLLSCGFV